MFELIVVSAIVVITSAICSLFEAVLYSVPISRIESLVQAGRTSGRILQRMRRNIDRPIAAILSLNTIANTAGAAIAGSMAAHILGTASLVYFSAAFTLIILVFSEVMPKTAGVVYTRTLAPIVAFPIQAIVYILTPLIAVTRLATRLVSRGGIESNIVSGEELSILVRIGRETGSLPEDEARVIQNVLALETRTVQDILTPRTVMFAIDGDLTLEDLRGQHLPHGRIPVYEENLDDILGIVHRRHILTAMAEDRWDTPVKDLMQPAHFVIETMSLDRLLRLFLDRRQQMFVAIDEFSGVSGVVTLEDVLEEVLGREIVGEFDQVVDMRELANRRKQDALKNRKDR